jgi:hypothetical protein
MAQNPSIADAAQRHAGQPLHGDLCLRGDLVDIIVAAGLEADLEVVAFLDPLRYASRMSSM